MKRQNWQAPGNGKIFDARFNEEDLSKSYMNHRTFWVLEYFYQKQMVEYIPKQITKDIDLFLKGNFTEYKNNKSLKTHFFKPLLFFGLITLIENNNKLFLILSMDGRNFLSSIKNKDYENALKYFFIATLWTCYPNVATPVTKNIGLFPFRILYSLIKNKDFLTTLEVKEKVVFINKIDDLINYEKFKEEFVLNKEEVKTKAEKFYTWVVNSLVDIGILLKKDNKFYLSSKTKTIIKLENIDLDNYDSMFFDLNSSETYLKARINFKKTNQNNFTRNRNLVKNLLKKYNYLCFFDKNHKTFMTNEGYQFLESHHIIPISMSKLINDESELDIIENLIPLCPNCHRSMHYSENSNKEKLLNFVWKYKNKELVTMNYTKNDLFQIYLDNLYLGRKLFK